MALQLSLSAIMYFASVELNCADVNFLLNQDITLQPKFKQQLEVLFLSPALHAQSKSINLYSINLSSPTYLIPYCTMPQVMEHMFCSYPVNFPWLNHILAQGALCKAYITSIIKFISLNNLALLTRNKQKILNAIIYQT